LISNAPDANDSDASLGIHMPADSFSEDIAALLRVLEEFEHSIGKRPISAHRQPAKLYHEAEPTSAVDRSDNRFVERIATAMAKLRVQAV
jgi:phosphoribosylcarboxyaminoimidazole (NCAIR) mutase